MADSSTSRNIIVILLLLAMAALAYSTWQRYELVEDTIDLGWSTKAMRQPYLAAEYFLRQHGIPVQQSYKRHSLEQLLEGRNEQPVDVLLISDSTLVEKPHRLEALSQWVSEGGHLIIGASGYNDTTDDALLTQFDFYTYQSEASSSCADNSECLAASAEPGQEQEEAENKDENTAKNLLDWQWPEAEKDEEEQTTATRRNQTEVRIEAERLSRLKFADQDYELQLNIDTKYGVWHYGLDNEDETTTEGYPLYRAGNHFDTLLVQLEQGEGLVTLLASTRLWDNRNIYLFDHALALKELVGQEQNVFILYGAQSADLFQRIVRYFPEALVSLTLLLLLWLWSQSVREGSVVQAPAAHRRALSEHIRAAAHYLWQSKHSSTLLEAARKDVQQKAATRWPGFEQLPAEKQLTLYQSTCDIAEPQLQQALFSEQPQPNTELFTDLIYTLQKIRKAL